MRPLILTFLGLTACMPDDYDGKDTGEEADADADADADTDADTDPADDQSIVGMWESSGDDVSVVLSDIGFTRVVASFEASGAYAVEAFYRGGSVDLAGTYTVDTSTSPATISVLQETPEAVTAAGIWQVQADGSLKYELTATNPNPEGYTPATVEDGFGSTAGAGLSPGDNLQIYWPL